MNNSKKNDPSKGEGESRGRPHCLTRENPLSTLCLMQMKPGTKFSTLSFTLSLLLRDTYSNARRESMEGNSD